MVRAGGSRFTAAVKHGVSESAAAGCASLVSSWVGAACGGGGRPREAGRALSAAPRLSPGGGSGAEGMGLAQSGLRPDSSRAQRAGGGPQLSGAQLRPM